MTEKEPSQTRRGDRNAEDLAMLRRIEAALAIEQLRASKGASERAAEHLGVYGGGYLCFMVGLFFASILFLPESAVSVCAGLTTLIVTSMIQLLKAVVSDEARPDSGSSNGSDK